MTSRANLVCVGVGRGLVSMTGVSCVRFPYLGMFHLWGECSGVDGGETLKCLAALAT